MSFVDAKNVHGEVQTVPEHFLEAFPDQFKPLTESIPIPTPPAKAATSKES
jgi:hypothetical protein